MRNDPLLHQAPHQPLQHPRMTPPILCISRNQDINVPAILLPAAVRPHNLDPHFTIHLLRRRLDRLEDLFTLGAGDARVEIVV